MNFIRLYCLILILFICGCRDNNTLSQIKFTTNTKIKVEINGSVKKSGVFLVDKGTDLLSLINQQSGFKSNASIPKNKVLKNGDRIFINSNRVKAKLNLNNATSTELIKIKGIGPKLAKKIIDYRINYGEFKSLVDLMKIKGIKDKLFNKIYEYLSV